MISKFTRIEFPGSLRLGRYGQSHVSSKTEDIAELKKILQMSLTRGTIDRAVK